MFAKLSSRIRSRSLCTTASSSLVSSILDNLCLSPAQAQAKAAYALNRRRTAKDCYAFATTEKKPLPDSKKAKLYSSIERYCNSFQVHKALGVVDSFSKQGYTVPTCKLNDILHACEKSSQFHLVHRVHSVICDHHLTTNLETFTMMINFRVKMKDLVSAHDLLMDMELKNWKARVDIYNDVFAGSISQVSLEKVKNIFLLMKVAAVDPNSQTYCLILSICQCEEDIEKCLEQLKNFGVEMKSDVFKACIKAYAKCGHFEMAEQVLLNVVPEIKNDVSSAFVSALAMNGQISNAFEKYEEMKACNINLNPEDILLVIENCKSEGELNRLLELLEQLNKPEDHVDGCCEVICYCVMHNHLSCAIDLLKQLKGKLDDDLAMKEILHEVFAFILRRASSALKFGMDLLNATKKDIGLRPTRQMLDFLLEACLINKALREACLIWRQYDASGLAPGVLSKIRMFEIFLACGDHKSAASMCTQIPKDEPVVCHYIQSMLTAHGITPS